WKGWAILLRQKQKKLIMLPSETMIWQPEFTDKTLSRKPGAVQSHRALSEHKTLSISWSHYLASLLQKARINLAIRTN
ncbi:hypothetical protein AAHD45_25335, partial [Escherichia coli]|uniref:hypothetical protein n=1 Tax=Escherichia coli TaxID=562 RepID=UPI003966BB32